MDITALAAGIFGGFIGNMIVNYFTKDLDFKYDYKRYILKKRQDVYDEVEKIVYQISNRVVDAETGYAYSSIFSNDKSFPQFRMSISDTIAKKVWLSDNMFNTLVAIRKYFEELDRDHPDFMKLTKREFAEWASSLNADLKMFSQDIYQTFFKDIKELDNIKEFKNQKNQEKLPYVN